MASLEILLDRRNRWQQVMNLELFTGVKDIFLHQLPQGASRKQNFQLTSGAVTPVPLFEFELRELFVEATVKSGCKWWCRNSRPSEAQRHVRRHLWSTHFVCRHHGEHYEKRPVDNSRVTRHILRCSCPASCVMKAISVMIVSCSSSFCSHSCRLITPTEDTDIWFFVTRPKLLNLENCVMRSIRTAQRPDCV